MLLKLNLEEADKILETARTLNNLISYHCSNHMILGPGFIIGLCMTIPCIVPDLQ